jgi:hypothetical protein
MKTGTSSLMDGKDYQERKVMRIDDINAMADADITKNETETLYTKQDMINLVQSLKDYTYESHAILGHDEREASEFVETFIDVFLLKNHLRHDE